MSDRIVGMVIFPGLTQLDLTGPHEVLSRLAGVKVRLFAATLDPVQAEGGLRMLPDATFDDAPQVDLLFVPGGTGVNAAMQDEAVIGFLRRQAPGARYVTSVCTGALVLGAAGLLKGYMATTHWLSIPLLAAFGAEPTEERVVVDRNRITGGGITAGIDFALRVAAEWQGEEVAREIALWLEYDPAPIFGGSPRTALEETLRSVREKSVPLLEERKRIVYKLRGEKPIPSR